MSESYSIEPVELAVTRWEFHVHSCTFCLSVGNELCFEGRYLAEDVADARDRSMKIELQAEPAPTSPIFRRPSFTGRRRPMFPEAVA